MIPSFKNFWTQLNLLVLKRRDSDMFINTEKCPVPTSTAKTTMRSRVISQNETF